MNQKVNVNEVFHDTVETMVKHNNFAYATGYLESMMVELLAKLPKKVAKQFVLDFQNEVESNIKVEVKSLMNGETVKISLKDKGTCLDPSQERYWSM